MKISILLLVFTVSSFAVTAQVKNFEIKASANTTFINSATNDLSPVALIPVNPATGYTYTTINLGSIRESYESKVGFEAAASFQAWEFKKFFLRTGLGAQYLRFHKKVTLENQIQDLTLTPGIFPGTDLPVGYPYGVLYGSIYPRDVNGNPILDPRGRLLPGLVKDLSQSPNLGKTTTLYLQIPVSIGRSFFAEKLMVAAGLQAQFLAQATVVKEEYSNGTITEYKDKSSDGFKNALFLVGVESAYKIVGPLAVSVSYNRSLTPIYDESSQVGGKTFYNNVSVGINYLLGN